MRTFTVPEPVFNTEPLFVIDCSYAAFGAYLQRRFGVAVDPDGGHVGQMYTFRHVPHRVIWSQKADLGTILHEVFHLVTRICADRGIRIQAHDLQGESGDETAAYLFEFFARAVLKRVRR